MHKAAAHATLLDRVWPESGNRALRAAALVVLGSILLAASAKAAVPMWPVPMTMQTFVVLLIGMTYGLRLGAATVAAYLLEGALGLSVFAGTPPAVASLAYMAGPTGGFLAGFVVAVAAMGWLVERGWGRGLARPLAVLALGTILPFVTGVAWLACLIGFERAIAGGLTPFLLGAAVKLALAFAVVRACESVVPRVRG
jgi:biotin transport system substrate-specific component